MMGHWIFATFVFLVVVIFSFVTYRLIYTKSPKAVVKAIATAYCKGYQYSSGKKLDQNIEEKSYKYAKGRLKVLYGRCILNKVRYLIFGFPDKVYYPKEMTRAHRQGQLKHDPDNLLLDRGEATSYAESLCNVYK